ncbi:hypothetical protein LguiA_035225 [Lonicera macranthoides]
MKKSCELCKSQARIYCESDQASLCWNCDVKVHSANFLVARHSRSLLCHVCQLPTAWNACGDKLGRTVSVCERCVEGCDGMKVEERCTIEEEGHGGNDDVIDAEGDYDDDDEDQNDDEIDVDADEDEDEDEENQVVPWSSTSLPPSASSSSNGESTSRFSVGDDVSSKRMRENFADLCSNDDLECSSSQLNNQAIPPELVPDRSTVAAEFVFIDSSMRPSKVRKIEPNRCSNFQHMAADSRSLGLVESLKRLHQQDMNSGDNARPAICPRTEFSVDFSLARAL